MEYYWCYLDAVLPPCIEFNSLQKRYTAHIQLIWSVVGGKVDGQISFDAISEKPKILFGVRGEKWKNLFGAK